MASVGLDGAVVPILRSADGDLATYQGQPFDEQVSFFRHRFCGVLQRGCDRLWPAGQKAAQFVFVFDGVFPDTSPELIQSVSDHFVMWMLNPPAVVYSSERGELTHVAGTIDESLEGVFRSALPTLRTTADDPDAWEVSQHRATWQPSEAV